jgi:hypothetical protein
VYQADRLAALSIDKAEHERFGRRGSSKGATLMATSMMLTTGQRSDERQTFARPPANTRDAWAIGPARTAAEPVEDDYEVIDFWGSGDSLSCLAAWG